MKQDSLFFTIVPKFYLSVLIFGDKNSSLILLLPFTVKTVRRFLYKAKTLGQSEVSLMLLTSGKY